jgi:hypothetical protein
MPVSLLEVLIRLRDEISDKMEKVKKSVEETGKGFTNLNDAVKAAGSALAAYGGVRAIGSFINETREANLMLAQAQFYANALGQTTAQQLMPQIIAVGESMEDLYGVSDELASKAYAKLIAKFGQGAETITKLTTLTKLHKLGLWDLSTSTSMLMGSTDEMRFALRYLARTLAIDVNPAMEDADEIFERIRKRLEGINFTPLGKQLDEFKERWSDIKEKIGTPFLEATNTVLQGVNWLLERFPILGDTIATVIGTIITALTSASLVAAVAGFGKLLGISALAGVSAFTGMAGAIGLAVGSILFSMNLVKDSMKKEGYEPTLGGLEKYLTDTFVGIGIMISDVWTKIKEFLGEVWEGIVIIAEKFWEDLKAGFADLVDKVIEFFKKLPYNIGYILGVLYQTIINAWNSIKDFLFVTVPSILNQIIIWFFELPGNVWNATISLKDKITDVFNKVWDEARRIVPQIIEDIVNFFRTLPGRIADAISSIPQVVGGVINQAGQTISKIGEEVKKGFEAGKAAVGLPSKQFGGYIPETGAYLLHRGEYVVPRGMALAGAGIGGINITITGNTFMSDEATAVKIGDMIVRALRKQVKF